MHALAQLLIYKKNAALAISREVLELFSLAESEDEHCLNLNVFAPSKPSKGPGYPVLLFIPGGGFQLGSNQMGLSQFAAFEDVIVVAINYRTNGKNTEPRNLRTKRPDL